MDIEDAGKGVEINDRDYDGKSIDKALVFPKSKKIDKHAKDVDEFKTTVPGTQKVWLKTYGCSHNISDSEYMEGMLTNYGFRMTNDQNDADVWLLNSCTVKDPSQAAFMHLVNKAKEKNLPVVVAGCVPQADRSITGLEDVSVIGVTQIDRVVEAVEQTLQGNAVKMLGKKELPALDLPKVRKNPYVEIIPLSTGCLGSCTYCKTRQARGKLGSYALDAIVDRAKVAISEGVSEIWLSSEDTGAYGRDINTNIGALLQSLIQVLPEHGVMLRVGMTNPPYMLEHLEVIAKILNHPNVYSFLHIPVQAGSNKVLTGMNREYTVEEFRQVADYLLEHVPGMTIATDIICGFPNESESDFDETLALIEHYKFAIVNISQFYPRPGTPAAKMKRIPTQIVKDRSRRLTKLFESFTPYTYLPGQSHIKVYFDIEVSDDGQHSVGHTKSYIKVLVPYNATLPGTWYYVKIISCSRFHVEGVLEEQICVSSMSLYQQKQQTLQNKLSPVSITEENDHTTGNFRATLNNEGTNNNAASNDEFKHHIELSNIHNNINNMIHNEDYGENDESNVSRWNRFHDSLFTSSRFLMVTTVALFFVGGLYKSSKF